MFFSLVEKSHYTGSTTPSFSQITDLFHSRTYAKTLPNSHSSVSSATSVVRCPLPVRKSYIVDVILKIIPMTAITVNLNPIIQLTDNQFYQLCQENPEVKFERNAEGKLLIMPPTGKETGNRNSEISADFVIWNRQTKLGICFDSSTCFKLPNGANRSFDVAWIRKQRWNALTPEEQEKFPPIAPDFVLELMSPSDSLRETQAQMQEYIDNGVKLGWLIHPKMRQVEIYRIGKPIEILASPQELSGEDVLPGFILNRTYAKYLSNSDFSVSSAPLRFVIP